VARELFYTRNFLKHWQGIPKSEEHRTEQKQAEQNLDSCKKKLYVKELKKLTCFLVIRH
jgi:hypothetical protein